jgi:hypothetical protein
MSRFGGCGRPCEVKRHSGERRHIIIGVHVIIGVHIIIGVEVTVLCQSPTLHWPRFPIPQNAQKRCV